MSFFAKSITTPSTHLLLLTACLFLWSIPNTQAQSTQLTVDWSGSPNFQSGDCNICGNDYACSNNFGDWQGGVKSFNDPIPTGNQINSITVRIDYTGCGTPSVNATLNGTSLGTFAPVQDCTCPSSCANQLFTWTGNFPNYNYGANNQFQLIPSGGGSTSHICVDLAQITFGYACVSSTDPSSISGPSSVNQGSSATLTVNGGSLASDANWEWYSGSCAGTYEGQGQQITVSPQTTTTYYARGEGGCNNTNCQSITVSVNSGGSGPCPNDNIAFDGNTYTPPCGPSALLNAGPGTFVQMNVVDGANYWFSTCGTGYDTKLTGYNGNSLVVFNDDNGPACNPSVEASVNWVANFSGVLTLNVDDEFCMGLNPSSAVLTYYQEDNLQATNSTADMCAGTSRTLSALPLGGTFSGTYVSGTTFSPPANAPGGSYNITYTLGACTEVQTINVDANSSNPTSIAGDNTVCPGGSTILSVVGGSLGANATWQWYVGNCGGVPIGSGNSISFAPTQDTTIWVRAEGSCNITDCASIDLIMNETPNGRITGTTEICIGESTDITFNFTAGSGPYDVTYTDGLSNSTLNNINNGHTVSVSPTQTTTYSYVSITDNNGCTRTSGFDGSAQITVNELPTIQQVEATDVLCNGESTGTITITGANGQAPYQYSIDGGNTYQFSNFFGGLPIGNYNAFILDDNGCSSAYGANPVVINEPPVLIVALDTAIDASCDGVFDGEIEVTAGGGVSPYQYSVNGGPFQPGDRFTGLAAGSYTVLVMDANGCQETLAPVTINNSYAVSVSIVSTTDASCFGGADGAFTASASGGVRPFSYSLDGLPYQPDSTFSNLSPGSYTVLARDSRGCIGSALVTIAEATEITVTIDSITAVGCNGQSTGSVEITTSGGTPGYTWSWSNGAATEDLTNIAAGTYNLTVTDANGCTTTESVTVDEPTELMVTIASVQDVSCNGDNDGHIDITVNGGTPGYTFAWSNGSTDEDLLDLTAGTYSVTVTDNNNCTQTAIATVNEPTALSLTSSGTDVTCPGQANGTATVSASGGVPPFSYLWSNGAITRNISNLEGGTYTVIVTDDNGCRESSTVVVNEPAEIEITAQVTDNACNGAQTGAIDITVIGGNGGFGYAWSNGETTEDVSGLSGGTYTVTVTDQSGCTSTFSATISEPSIAVSGSTTSEDISCFGANDGSINLTVNGGTPPYAFDWSNGETSEDLANLGPNTYTVEVLDANGCNYRDTVTINEPAELQTSIVGTNVTCFGGTDGAADLTITGGVQPYSILWSTFEAVEDINNLEAGQYAVIVTDANGCERFDSITITQPDEIVITLAVTDVTCEGFFDGAIDATVTGGAGQLQFSWSSGQVTEDISGVGAGVYTLNVTDANGCTATATAEVMEPDELIVSGIVTDVACAGDSAGAIDLSVRGGDGNYFFTWSNGATTEDISGLSGGSYLVTVSDGNGCTDTDSFFVQESAALAINLDSTDVSCFAAADGSASVTVTDGTPPYTYQWSTFQTTSSISGLGPGTYYVIVTDANGCELQGSTTVNEPDAIEVVATITDVSCSAAADGAIDLQVTGGDNNYGYNWSNGDTTRDVSGLSGGTYTVTIADGNNCEHIESFTIAEPDALVVTGTTTDVSCGGGFDGAIDVSVTGGTENYSFNWSGGETTEDLNNLNAGVYTITVTDGNACTATQSFTINEPDSFTLSLTSTEVTCWGAEDGTASATVNGGTAPFSYQWSTFETTDSISNLGPGTYYLTVTDLNGCTVRDNISISQPDPVEASFITSDVSCAGADDGSIDMTVTGGDSSYTFNWSNGETTEDLSGLAGGTYDVTITDGNSCQTIQSVTVNEPDSISINGSTTDVTCANAADGAIDIEITGGNGNFTYNWSNGETTQDLSGLAGGAYTLTVSDGNSCTASASYTINEPPALATTMSSTDVSCFGASDGTANVQVAGGILPYTYQWSTFQTTAVISGLDAGTYYVIVTDANGCTIQDSVNVDEPDELLATLQTTDVTCAGADDGSIDLTVIGGNGGNTFAWSNGETTEDISGLSGGTYTVTIQDANNCELIESATINEPDSIDISGTTTDVSCAAANDGGIDLTVTGGDGNFTFSWSNGDSTEDLSGVSGGTYDVTVEDGNGCTATASYTINEPTPLVLVMDSTDVTCSGADDGTASVSVSGGTPPYTYQWSTFEQTASIANLGPGTYFVIVTDANGCTMQDDVSVNEPDALIAMSVVTDVSCANAADGAIDLTVTGGNGGNSFTWSNGETTEDISGLSGGTYTVTVVDTNGCSLTHSAVVQEPDSMIITGETTDASCNGAADGSIDITVTGGDGNYTYSWSNNETTEDISDLSGGSYSVTTTDGNGCTATASYTINEPTALVLSTDSTDVTCFGANDGSVSVNASGGTAPYTYQWSTFQTSPSISGVGPGMYYVIVTDANGCSMQDSVSVNEPPAISATWIVTDVSCAGANDGAIDLSVSGGVGSYTYNWSNGDTTEDISGLAGGTYIVTITDANQCELVESILITEPDAISVTASSQDVSCFGSSDGSIDVSVSGGSSPYGYDWSNGETTEDISGLSAGTYTLVVTDANTCSDTSDYTIAEPANLQTQMVSTDVTCPGSSDGAAEVIASGGTAPYTYLWSTFRTDASISGLSGGWYFVIVEDANGCSTLDSILIIEPEMIVITDNVSEISCFGETDGEIAVTVTGGSAPYQYLWSDGSTTSNISALGEGTYSLTVVDQNGCVAVDSFTLVEPTLLSLSIVSHDISCNGAADGEIDMVISGGTQAYDVQWSNGATTLNQTGLSAGTYSVTVTDDRGCEIVDSIGVVEPQPIVLDEQIDQLTCSGRTDGSIVILAAGGTPPFTYEWAHGPTRPSIDSLADGVYTVTVTDYNGCSASETYNLSDPTPITVNLTGVDLSCHNSCDGSAEVTVSGGSPPYVILWNTFSTSPSISDLCAGQYTVIVEDINRCINSKSIQINEPDEIAGSGQVTHVNCYDGTDGAVDLTMNGGAGGLSYEWTIDSTTVSTAEDLTSAAAGSYQVVVSDTNSCSETFDFEIDQPTQLISSMAGANLACSGSTDGFATVDVTGGNQPYTYLWSTNPPETGLGASNLAAGWYWVTITDKNGCNRIDSIEITEPNAIAVTVDTRDVTCFNGNNGNVTILAEGGQRPYSYTINGIFQFDSVFTNMEAGDFIVKVEDANGCSGTEEFQVLDLSGFNIDLGDDFTMVRGQVINLGTLDVNSINPVIGYNWSPPEGLSCTDCESPDISPEETTTYIIDIMDSDSCVISDTLTVTVLQDVSVFVPTGFTPNGDGLNETFDFEILGASSVEVQIFNRWGELIYHNPNQESGVGQGWDGTKDGVPVPLGTYTYQFLIETFTGEARTESGTVTVVK